MFGLGPTELIIIAAIIIFIFGAKRLPGIGKTMGETVKELGNIKKEMHPKEAAKKVVCSSRWPTSVSAQS